MCPNPWNHNLYEEEKAWRARHDQRVLGIIPAADHITDSKRLDNKSNEKILMCRETPDTGFSLQKIFSNIKVAKWARWKGDWIRSSECCKKLSLIKKESGPPYNIDLNSFSSAGPADRKDQHIKTQFSNCNA